MPLIEQKRMLEIGKSNIVRPIQGVLYLFGKFPPKSEKSIDSLKESILRLGTLKVSRLFQRDRRFINHFEIIVAIWFGDGKAQVTEEKVFLSLVKKTSGKLRPCLQAGRVTLVLKGYPSRRVKDSPGLQARFHR